MANFIMMIGLPGSGKSYYTRERAKSNDVIISSDSIREELYGDAAIQDNPSHVFELMYKCTKEALQKGTNVYYDATNISAKRRINFLKQLKKDCPNTCCNCVIMVTPIDVCQERNAKRERVVPAHVIDRMLRQFEIPCKGEGWDKILINYNYAPNYNMDYYRRSYARLVEEYGEQGNSHHTLTLQEHCYACGDFAIMHGSNSNVARAAYLHDYGKVWTATRWEKDDYKELHYPNHANVGAYMTLVMGCSLHVAQLVAYHMLPYTDQKCQDTWRSRIGEELWKEVMELHSCDKGAH